VPLIGMALRRTVRWFACVRRVAQLVLIVFGRPRRTRRVVVISNERAQRTHTW
jgi:hypothetical protein